jgi:cytochrome o ubiquinol oxidase subunit III
MNDKAHEESMTLSKTNLGFWMYLMTDCLLFGALFATYAVLHNNTYGGPGSNELFDLSFVLIETMLLLASSYTCGLAVIAARKRNMNQVLILLGVTFLLGLGFLGMELNEFSKLASEGHSWTTSAFLSAFFTLVGTHGVHITIGLLWLTVIAVQLRKDGFTPGATRRLGLFSVFWHFLDVIWIFIFTIVYLMGVI